MNTATNSQLNQQNKAVPANQTRAGGFPIKEMIVIFFIAMISFNGAFLLTSTISRLNNKSLSPFSILTALADTVSDTFTTTTKISAQSNVVISGGKVTLQRQF